MHGKWPWRLFVFYGTAGRPSRRRWFAGREEALRTALRAKSLPMVSRFGNEMLRASEPEAIFEFGLRCVLDGIAAKIDG